MSKKQIKKVAIYLRKSRGDEDKDILSKHRIRLTKFANEKKWGYDLFEEAIKSGERLSNRPKIMQLLTLVEDGSYDGVLVVEYQRLSRGSSKDFGEIIEALAYSNTVIITPDRIYDTNDTNDLAMLGIQSVFSNTELRTIVGRLIEGKRDGAKLGKWTNGKPPYPYEYAKKIVVDSKGREVVSGEVIVNTEKEKVYIQIKQMYLLDRIGTQEIAYRLNRQQIPSPNNTFWNNNTVKRLLINEFHIGRVIYGKNEWKKNRDNKRRLTGQRDEAEWACGVGTHQVLKTPEEHQQVIKQLTLNQKIPHRSRAGTFITSGILYCKKCGYRMAYSVGRMEAKTGKSYDYTKCSHHEPDGRKCSQKGIKMDEDFYQALFNAIISDYISKGNLLKIQESKRIEKRKQSLLEEKRLALSKAEFALKRIMDGYESGTYSSKQFAERKKVQDKLIQSLNAEIFELHSPKEDSVISSEELQNKLRDFKLLWEKSAIPPKINALIKSFVKRIYYDRECDEVYLHVEYL